MILHWIHISASPATEITGRPTVSGGNWLKLELIRRLTLVARVHLQGNARAI